MTVGLLNSFTLYISSTDVIIGITTLEEIFLFLPVTTHRKTTANVKAREGVEGELVPQEPLCPNSLPQSWHDLCLEAHWKEKNFKV